MENTNAEEQNIENTKVDEVELEASEEVNEDNVEVLNADSKNEDEDFKQKYYYLAAEMQNMQRRFDKDKENLLKYGSEKILRDILDVVDNFERTLGFIQADEDEKVKNIAVGIDMIAKQFISTLENHGLKKVDALGKEFDPNFHEALSQQAVEGKKEMEIIQVHQAVYTLNERLLRPAKVVVVKNED
jgi:molecular chaperone GrpE